MGMGPFALQVLLTESYCMSKKSCPFSYRDYTMKRGQDFLDSQYTPDQILLYVPALNPLVKHSRNSAMTSVHFLPIHAVNLIFEAGGGGVILSSS